MGYVRPLLIFAILTAVYFWDVSVYNLSLAVGDGIFQFYPALYAACEQYRQWGLPLWYEYVFSGFPLMATTQGATLYPPNVALALALGPLKAINPLLMLHLAGAGFFTFLYMRRIGLEVLPAMFSGMVFGLLGYLPSRLIHISIILTGAWLPLILYFMEGLSRYPSARNTALAALAIGMMLLAGHPQIIFYGFLVTAAYAVHILAGRPPEGGLRFAGLGVMALLGGTLLALPQIIATWELSSFWTRAEMPYEYFAQLPFPPFMAASLLFPFLFGHGYGGPYWGPETDVTIMDGFVGCLPLLLAMAAFWKAEKEERAVRFWGIVAVAAFVLALGDSLRPLNRIMFHIPIYNLFRSPSRHMVEVTFALSVLSGYGMRYLIGEGGGRFRKAVAALIASAAGISVICFTVFRGAIGRSLRGLELRDAAALPGALGLDQPAVYVPLLFMALYAAVLLAAGRERSSMKGWLGYVLMMLVFFEALSYKTLYTYTDPSYAATYQRGLFSFLAEDKSDRAAFVTLEVPESLLAVPYGVSSIDGYDSLLNRDYSELLNMETNGFSFEWADLIRGNLILSMLNARYLVVDKAMGGLEAIRGRMVADGGSLRFTAPIGPGLPSSKDYGSVYMEAYKEGKISVYENLNSLPRAYAVRRLRAVDSVEDLRLVLYAFQMDPWVEAAVSQADLKRIGRAEFDEGSVALREHAPNRVALDADFKGEGFIVLADQYYPGWKAYVDGKETEIYKANGVLRGILVPGGAHEVVLVFRPIKIYASAFLSVLTFALIVIIIIRGSPWKEKTD